MKQFQVTNIQTGKKRNIIHFKDIYPEMGVRKHFSWHVNSLAAIQH